MRGRSLAALAAGSLVMSACTHTRQFADIGFRPPAGSYSLIVMRPDVSVGLLTAGGAVERRQDWTDHARDNLLKALTEQQAGHGGRTVIASTFADTGADPAAAAELEHLHAAVGQSIRIHKLAGLPLPTKQDRFDWTLGDDAVRFGQVTHYDYALFLHAEDSFSSTGRVALQALAMVGCLLAICAMPGGGQQAAYASLVDLKTGKVVWFNALASSVGDIRTEDGARTMVARLLDRMKPGAEGAAGGKARKAV